jgi:hypothetical protein
MHTQLMPLALAILDHIRGGVSAEQPPAEPKPAPATDTTSPQEKFDKCMAEPGLDRMFSCGHLLMQR